jgi:thioredoxin 1
MAFEVTDGNFQKEVLDRKGVSVLDFWAEWCGPCRMIDPIIKNLSVEYKDKDVLVGKVNVGDNPEIPVKYGIISIPTILIIKDGQEVKRQVGYTTQANLAKLIDAQLS